MKWLVPPTSFSEGQRAIYGCMVALAGMFAGLVSLGFIAIFFGGVIYHVWPEARFEQIIAILGYGFAGFILAMIAVILTLAVGGPVGRFKGGASLKDGVNFDLANDETAAKVETSTITTVTPVPAKPQEPLP